MCQGLLGKYDLSTVIKHRLCSRDIRISDDGNRHHTYLLYHLSNVLYTGRDGDMWRVQWRNSVQMNSSSVVFTWISSEGIESSEVEHLLYLWEDQQRFSAYCLCSFLVTLMQMKVWLTLTLESIIRWESLKDSYFIDRYNVPLLLVMFYMGWHQVKNIFLFG